MEYKEAFAEIKELNEKGEGILRFIKFHQEDKDSDITLPGFIGRQKAHLLPGHNWRSDHPPLGSGESFEADGATNFKFRLNLNTALGKEWRDHLLFDRQYGQLQQVSYGFQPYADATEKWQKDGRSGRYLKPRKDGSPGAKLFEVSFVVVGSGNDTAVLDVKSTDVLLRGDGQKENGGMAEPEVPVVESVPDTPQEPLGDETLPSVEDYKNFPEDRRPPLSTMITWIRLYRYHMPFLQDIRKRDHREMSPEIIRDFKTLIEECIEVASQLGIALLNADRMPTAEEQERQKQQHAARFYELTAHVKEQADLAYQQLQAQAEELARAARVRSARMKELHL